VLRKLTDNSIPEQFPSGLDPYAETETGMLFCWSSLTGDEVFMCVMKSIQQITEEALQLPPNGRAEIAEALLESLAAEGQWLDTNSETMALALERDHEISQGKVTPLSHEEFMNATRYILK